jgi:hypothetical protein
MTESIKYDAILMRFQEAQQEVDASNMRRYHRIGELFDEFCGGLERQVYGDHTVQKLADDLQARGVLSDIAYPVRYLYWARTIYQFDTSYTKIEQLVKRGFSVTHAKLVFSLEDKLRERIITMLLKSEQLPSTRELETQLRLEASSEAAKSVSELSKEREAVTPPTPADKPVAEGSPQAKPQESSGKEEKSAREPSKKESKAATSGSKDSPATDAEAHPLKAIKGLEKIISKMVVAIPDGFIAVNTAEKRGFDSDKAQKNYATELSNLRSAVNGAIKPLEELKALLDSLGQ